jgi:hypothetical protein
VGPDFVYCFANCHFNENVCDFLFHCVDACFGFLVVSLLRLVCDLGKIMLM